MFQFRRFPSYTYLFSIWYTSFSCMDCSIRKSAGHSLLTTYRSLSQLTTSFFGSQCQGIRPALFLALPFVFLSSLKIHCSFIYPTSIFYFTKNRVVSLDCISSYFDIQFSRYFYFPTNFINWMLLLLSLITQFTLINLSIDLIEKFFYSFSRTEINR